MTKTTAWIASARVAAALAASAPVRAQDAQLFERLAGGWSGGGVVSAMGGGNEGIRCRGRYTSSGPSRLELVLACASDSFKLQVASDLARQGSQISGTWRESSFGVSGAVNGTIRGNRIDAVVSGFGVTARLDVSLRGNVQGVTLVSQGQISGRASVQLRRQ